MGRRDDQALARIRRAPQYEVAQSLVDHHVGLGELPGAKLVEMDVTVTTQATTAGEHAHFDTERHTLRVHAADSVRVSCRSRTRELVRARGQFDLLPAGQRERWSDHDAGVVLEVTFDRAWLASVTDAVVEPRFHARDVVVEQLVWALELERRAGSPHGTLYRDGLALALTGRLVQRAADPAVSRGTLDAAQRRRVIDAIAAELVGDLSIGRLARIAGVSPSHFKVVFKRTFGLTPHAYVMRERTARARQLLEGTDMQLAAIAYDLGFAHPSHLARWMRRLFGASPRELRQR